MPDIFYTYYAYYLNVGSPSRLTRLIVNFELPISSEH